MSMGHRILATSLLAVVIAVASALAGGSAKAGTPTWESISVDDAYLLPLTSAACAGSTSTNTTSGRSRTRRSCGRTGA